MPNRYMDLPGQEPISETYQNIEAGFDAVQEDVDAATGVSEGIQAEVTQHKDSATAHAAEHITYAGPVVGAADLKTAVDSVKQQLDTAVLNGDSSIAAAQAAIDVEGVEHPSLKARIDSDVVNLSTQLAETAEQISAIDEAKADKTEVNALANEKASKAEVALKADQSFVDSQLAAIVSGAPKGTYTNLAALQAAYPSGTDGVMLTLDTGHWYYWSGSTWADGGQYQSTGIADDSITNHKIVDRGLFKNRGADYPLYKLSDSPGSSPSAAALAEIQNAILDIQVLNAAPNTDYSVRYIGKNQTTYGDAVLIEAYDRTTNTKKYDLFKLENRQYPIDDSGVSTLRLLAEKGDEIIYLTLDYSVIGSNQPGRLDLAGNGWGNNRIHPSCLTMGTEGEGSVYFPLKQPAANYDPNLLLTTIKQAILETKIHNAQANTIYKIRYIGKNQATFGNMVLVEAWESDNSAMKYALFKAQRETYPINAAGITKLTLASNNGYDELVELVVDYSKIPNDRLDIGNSALFGFYVDPVNYHIATAGSGNSFNNVVNANFTARTFDVAGKRSAAEDYTFGFAPYAINNIVSIQTIYKSSNSTADPIINKSAVFYTTGTDWVSPYKVRALSGGDSPIVGDEWTGGAHGTAGAGGEPTARTSKVRLFVDGVEKTTDGTYTGGMIEIIVINDIEAYNTHTNQRYVIQERIKYTIKGTKLDVHGTIHCLEAVEIKTYYAMQTVGFYESVKYLDSADESWIATNINSDSGAKSAYPMSDTRILRKNTGELLTVFFDNSYGLGDREYLTDTSALSATFSYGTYGKSYTNILVDDPTNFSAGDLLYWRGYYWFK